MATAKLMSEKHLRLTCDCGAIHDVTGSGKGGINIDTISRPSKTKGKDNGEPKKRKEGADPFFQALAGVPDDDGGDDSDGDDE